MKRAGSLVCSYSKAISHFCAPAGAIAEAQPDYLWDHVGGDVLDYMLLVVDSQRNREIHNWYPAADICDGATCVADHPLPLPEDNYNWYLKARNPAGSAWGTVQRFTIFTGVLTGPATPGLNLPQGNYSWQLKSRNPLGAAWSSRLDFRLAAAGAGGEG